MVIQKRPDLALPVEFYKKIAIAFIILTSVLFGVVLYLTLLRATIEIVPKKDTLSADLLMDLRANPQHKDEVVAEIFEIILEKSGTFQATATSTEKIAPQEFNIQILNTTQTEQTLIPKTRFMSPDGFLYRLKNRVTIPAGKIITAVVSPDPQAPVPEVDTRFTLPGLPLNKQKVIYGQMLPVTNLPETGKIITAISETDVAEAFKELENNLVKEGQNKLQKQISKFDNPLYIWKMTVLEKRANAMAGELSETFEVSVRLKVVLAALDKNVMLAKGDTLLGALVPQDKVLLPLTDERFKYDIVNYDMAAGSAMVKVSVSGATVPSIENPLIQSARFAGLNKDEVSNYLKDTNIAEIVRVRAIPPWLKKLPKNPERIKVILKDS